MDCSEETTQRRVKEALMADPEGKHWLEKLDNAEGDSFVKWLSKMFEATCARTKQDIIDHLDREFAGVEESNKQAMLDIAQRIMDQFNKNIEDLKTTISSVEFKRKQDRIQTDKNTSEINLLKHANANMAIKVDAVVSNTAMVPEQFLLIQKSLNTMHESMNHIRESSSKPAPEQKTAGIPLGKLSWFAAIAAGVSFFLLIAMMLGFGDDAIAMIRKLFGG